MHLLMLTNRDRAHLGPAHTGGVGGGVNSTLSVDFVLHEAASLSFLTYNKKLNNV